MSVNFQTPAGSDHNARAGDLLLLWSGHYEDRDARALLRVLRDFSPVEVVEEWLDREHAQGRLENADEPRGRYSPPYWDIEVVGWDYTGWEALLSHLTEVGLVERVPVAGHIQLNGYGWGY